MAGLAAFGQPRHAVHCNKVNAALQQCMDRKAETDIHSPSYGIRRTTDVGRFQMLKRRVSMKIINTLALGTVLALGLATAAQAQSPAIPTPANPFPENPIATNGTPLNRPSFGNSTDGLFTGRSAFAPVGDVVGTAGRVVGTGLDAAGGIANTGLNAAGGVVDGGVAATGQVLR
jgi:hypothetical protein